MVRPGTQIHRLRFIHPPGDGHLSCFQFGAMMLLSNIHLRFFVWTSSWPLLRCSCALSCANHFQCVISGRHNNWKGRNLNQEAKAYKKALTWRNISRAETQTHALPTMPGGLAPSLTGKQAFALSFHSKPCGPPPAMSKVPMGPL